MNSVAYGATELIDINFFPYGGTYSGTAYEGIVNGESGTQTWNNFYEGTMTNQSLNYADGTGDSGVDISYDFTSVDGSYESGFSSGQYAGLMNGNVYTTNGTTATLSFSGLTANTSYTLYVYTQPNGVTLNGQQLTVTSNGTTIATSAAANTSTSTFVLGQNVLMETVTSNDKGEINLTFSGSGIPDARATVNGIQLQEAVPEPASVALLGVGGAFLFGFRKLNSKEESAVA